MPSEDEYIGPSGEEPEQKAYGKIIYGSAHDVAPLFQFDTNYTHSLISTRYVFPELTIAQPDTANPPIPNLSLPDSDWTNYGTYPSYFSRVKLTGTAWTHDTHMFGQDVWVFKPQETGVYKLRISCSWYCNKHPLVVPSEYVAYQLENYIHMGLYLMKAGDGDLGPLTDAEAGIAGDEYSNATLLALSDPWKGYQLSIPTPVQPPTTPEKQTTTTALLLPVEVMVRVGAGEEIIPFVSWFALSNTGPISCIDRSRTWKNIHHASDTYGVYVWSNLVYNWTNGSDPLVDQRYIPVYGTETSFSYERMLGL